MSNTLIVAFDRLSQVQFQAKVGTIRAALNHNPYFPEPWAKEAPSLAELDVAFDSYKEAYHASLTRDMLKIDQRDAARQVLTDLLKRLASYLELVAPGDAIKLATTGFDLRRESVRSNNQERLEAPDNLRAAQGPQSGSISVHVSRLPSAGSYEVHLAQGDAAIESNWKHVLISTSASHMLIEGLTPLQTYWVRVRGIDRRGNGHWTDPAKVVII